MPFKILAYNFTALWSVAPRVVFIQDNAFCKELFGDPNRTNAVGGNNGFIISRHLEPGVNVASDFVILNQQTIQIVTSDLKKLSNVLQKLRDKISEINEKPFVFTFYLYNLIIDAETVNLKNNYESVPNFLSRMINREIEKTDQLSSYSIGIEDIVISFNDNNKNEKIQFQIQPRVSNPNELFIKTTGAYSDDITVDLCDSIEGKFIRQEEIFSSQIQKIIYG